MSAPLSAEKVREEALRNGISELLDQCTEKQQAFLHHIHNAAPWKGLANCPVNKLPETYELLRRTVIENTGA